MFDNVKVTPNEPTANGPSNTSQSQDATPGPSTQDKAVGNLTPRKSLERAMLHHFRQNIPEKSGKRVQLKRTFAECLTEKEVTDRLQENQQSKKGEKRGKQQISKSQISKPESDEDDQEKGFVIIELLKIGNYVKIEYEVDRFPGVVEKTNDTERSVTINVMIRSGHQYWKWPTHVDRLNYHETDVLKKLSDPAPVSNREL